MARYRILESVRSYRGYADGKDNPKRVSTSFKIEKRSFFRWNAFKERSHPLWRLFDSLEDAKKALEEFVEDEKRKKDARKNPQVVHSLNTRGMGRRWGHPSPPITPTPEA